MQNLVLDFSRKNLKKKLYCMNQIKHIISKISPAGYQFAPFAAKVWIINVHPTRLIISC